jgi:hypothetical protein
MALTKINNNTLSAVTTLPAAIATGKVLQVVGATDNSLRSTTSTSFVTGSNTLTVDITPSATSSKILVFVQTNGYHTDGLDGCFTIFRDSTDLGGGVAGLLLSQFGVSGAGQAGVSLMVLDSPSSTSALTYQMYFRVQSGSYTVETGQSDMKSSIIAMEIGA